MDTSTALGAGQPLSPAAKIGAVQGAILAEILPAGGQKVLDAAEALAPQPSKAAADLLAATLTPDCASGIRAASVIKYVIGFVPMMQADRDKRTKELLAATAKLRLWGVVSKAYLLALNERALTDAKGAPTAVGNELAALVATLQALGIADSVTANFLAGVASLKAAEGKLFAAQVAAVGGLDLALYEWHPGTNTTQISWNGPVAVRSRIAGQADNPDAAEVAALKVIFGDLAGSTDGVALDKLLVFPVPSIIYGSANLDAVNPWFGAAVPGYADLFDYYYYDYQGMNKGTSGWDDTTNKITVLPDALRELGAFLTTNADALAAKATFDAFVQEQVQREYAALGKKVPVAKSYDNAFYPFGLLIDLGLAKDPEWGGKSLVGDSKTPHEVADAVLPKVRAVQTLRRNVLGFRTKSPTGILQAHGEYAAVQDLDAAIKGDTTDMAILPPLVAWIGNPKTGFVEIAPVPAAQWKQYITDPKQEVAQSFQAWVTDWNARFWAGAGPDANAVADAVADTLAGASGVLAKWVPDAAGKLPPLPWPLIYPLDAVAAKLPTYVYLSAQKLGDVLGTSLTQAQEDLIQVRGDYKSAVLLAMRAAEFASTAMDGASALIAAIEALCAMLYGQSDLVAPPDGTDKTKLYGYYSGQIDAFAAAPKPGSLAAVLAAASAAYLDAEQAQTTADSDAARKKASLKTTLLAEKAAKVQERVNVLTAELKGKLAQVQSDIADPGGVFYYVAQAGQLFDFLAKYPTKVKIAGTDVNIAPSPEEQAAITATKAQIAVILAKANNAAAIAGATAGALPKIVNSLGAILPANVLDGLNGTSTWAQTVLGKPGSMFWLLLLAAGATAAHKGG